MRIAYSIALYIIPPIILFFSSFSYAQRSTIKLQLDENYPPFSLKYNNYIYGFDKDLMNLIFNNKDYILKYSSGSWKDLLTNVKKDNIHITSLIAKNKEREKFLFFTKPVLQSYTGVYSIKNFIDVSLENLSQYKIGVVDSYYEEGILRDILNIDDYITYENPNDLIHGLMSQEVDIVFSNQDVMDYYIIQKNLKSIIIPRITNRFPVDFCYGINKSHPELVKYINNRIEELKKNGIYEELYIKYFYDHSQDYMRKKQYKTYFIISISFILLIIIFIFTRLYIKYLRQKITKEKSLSQNIIDNSNIFIVLWKIDGSIISINKFTERTIGYSEEYIRFKKWDQFVDFSSTNVDKNFIIEKVNSGINLENIIAPIISKDNKKIDVSWNICILPHMDNEKIFGISMGIDISQRLKTENQLTNTIEEYKQAQKKIKYMAYYDSLTQLPNKINFKSMLTNYISNAIKDNTKIAILFLDLDNFKAVNDTFGHSTGDTLIKKVAYRLKSISTGQVSVARMGGDEFILSITNIYSRREIIDTLEEIINLFNTPFNINNRNLYISASIGISIYPDNGVTEQSLFRNADVAMYKAKKQGKNKYHFFTNALYEDTLKSLEYEQDLRMALSRKELELHYQPIIDISKHKIISVEGLLRWRHQSKGMISPMDFIPIAEETGLIIPIGEWVIESACSQLVKWRKQGIKNIKMSINLSPYQIQYSNLSNTIKDILDKTSCPAEHLQLEITESMAIVDLDKTIYFLREMKALGVKIALDDFGTGYSGLNYLAKLPIDTVKIDKEFIKEIPNNCHCSSLLNAIIELSHQLGKDVIAEGVENKIQLDLLNSYKCDMVQGYYFSKPLSSLKTFEFMKGFDIDTGKE
ncbi:EAL domain-containing protein [Clostridiisalibacter paucivorans]|uniref:EAL domain-containing protein n=1 Tax=Clostridiisalibacter paucivorans TaxID=408753 RepID=UPI0006852D59|nr:EAL domain-containing protein [Clostridiisalibacter paucivorans]